MYRNAKQWHRIRRSILENGVPKKRISRETGISRKTINKMLTHEDPPSSALLGKPFTLRCRRIMIRSLRSWHRKDSTLLMSRRDLFPS